MKNEMMQELCMAKERLLEELASATTARMEGVELSHSSFFALPIRCTPGENHVHSNMNSGEYSGGVPLGSHIVQSVNGMIGRCASEAS